jgi:hypothetical protein
MDMRAAYIFRRIDLSTGPPTKYYRVSVAHALMTYYLDSRSGEFSMTQAEKRKVMQAADSHQRSFVNAAAEG